MSQNFFEITGKRIKLRDWTTSDLKTYKQYQSDHHKWMELDAPYYERSTEAETDEHLKNIAKRITEKNWNTPRRRLIIADLENNLIGSVSWYWQSKATNWISIGITIYDEQYWGKGIGFEAFGFWCEYLFRSMPDISRLDLRTWSGNTGMMRLSEKLGFKQEACFRKARIYKGKYFDSIGYGILREEWNEGLSMQFQF